MTYICKIMINNVFKIVFQCSTCIIEIFIFLFMHSYMYMYMCPCSMFQSFDEARQVPVTSRKAYTPDLSRSTHHRNTSDTAVVSSLTFDVSPSHSVGQRAPSEPTETQSSSGSLVGVASSETPPPAEAQKSTGSDDVDIESGSVSDEGTVSKETITPSEKSSENLTEDTQANTRPADSTQSKEAVVSPPVSSAPPRSLGTAADIKKCHMSVLFRRELLDTLPQLSGAESEIMADISQLSDPDLSVIDLLSRRIPDVIENTILPKREVSPSLYHLIHFSFPFSLLLLSFSLLSLSLCLSLSFPFLSFIIHSSSSLIGSYSNIIVYY